MIETYSALAGLALKIILTILKNRDDPMEAAARVSEIAVEARNERLHKYQKGVEEEDRDRVGDVLRDAFNERLRRRMQNREEETRLDKE